MSEVFIGSLRKSFFPVWCVSLKLSGINSLLPWRALPKQRPHRPFHNFRALKSAVPGFKATQSFPSLDFETQNCEMFGQVGRCRGEHAGKKNLVPEMTLVSYSNQSLVSWEALHHCCKCSGWNPSPLAFEDNASWFEIRCYSYTENALRGT